MDFNDLTPEQQEMARACKSLEELAELAESFGMHVSDEELASVAGGPIRGGDSPSPSNAHPVESSGDNPCPPNLPCPIYVCKWQQRF